MNNTAVAPRHPIYAARWFDASPTWFAWNKFTVADVYALREEPGFEGQGVFFYLNHPIRFVRLVGIIMQVDMVADGRIFLVTLDDSSGANINLRIRKQQSPVGMNTLASDISTQADIESDLKIWSKMGEPMLFLDGKRLGLGDVVRAQGTLTTFRGDRQLDLKKLFAVKDTNEEVVRWNDVAKWKQTLSTPWVLTDASKRALLEKQRTEDERRAKRAQAKQKMQDKLNRKREARETEYERRRKSEEAEMNAGALNGSERLFLPWDD